MTAHAKHHPHHPKTHEDIAQEHELRTFLEWHAPGRPYTEHSREFYINAFLIMGFVEIILFLFGQYMLMLVVFALVFLTFAMSIVPPHDFYFKITSQGIRIEDQFYIWEELYDFFFIQHHGQDVLYLTTKDFFTGELKITLGDISTDQIKSALLPYLPYREYVKPTFTEKAGQWLAKNFPLEKQ